GAALFPAVAMFETIVPPLATGLLKLQTIMAAWFFGATSIAATTAIFVVAMPRAAWEAKFAPSPQRQYYASWELALGIVVFALLAMYAWSGGPVPLLGGRFPLSGACCI